MSSTASAALQNRLKSTKAIEVAVELSNRWLQQIDAQNPGMAGRLRVMRNVVWNLNSVNDEVLDKPLSAERKKELFDSVLADLKPEQQKEVLESYARLGHISEIAGLVARENYFEHCRAKTESGNETPIPGGVNKLLADMGIHIKGAKGEDISFDEGAAKLHEVLERINKPVFEVVMTQHPTNTNTIPFMQAQRALAIEVEKANKGQAADIDGALQRFQAAEILKTSAGKPANFTVRDEIDTIVNTLNNLYDDLPRVYGQYDRPLSQAFNREYDPAALKLNMRFDSWGSAGDKDGNANITAYNTLEAISLHNEAILKRYSKDLEGLQGLEGWKTKIDSSLEQVTALRRDISFLRQEQEDFIKHPPVNAKKSEEMDKRFDVLSKQLAAARKGLEPKQFEADIEAAYKGSHDEKTLELLRRVHTFGFTFGKIEYRETAEEYAKVVGSILGDQYPEDSEQRIKLLEGLLRKEGGEANLNKEFNTRLNEVLKTGAGNAYDSGADKSLAIVYQTLKRMQLARDHGDMITHNVLAECGKLKDTHAGEKAVADKATSNMLEAQFLQRVVADDAHPKGATVAVVPLFEEPETMLNIKAIMSSIYDNAACNDHMRAVADKHYDGKLTQQVQIAHSDNARRSGVMAARALIHEAHQDVRELTEKRGINIEFFEGGSMSDAYRNGLRCPSGMIDAFGLHDFAKMTFQGGDLLNYFNVPCAMERLFTRNISAQSRGNVRAENGKGHSENPKNEVMEEVAINALKRTLADYEKNDFQREKIGLLLEALDYDEETRAGNATSRAAARKVAFGKVDSTQVGSVEEVQKPELTGTPIDKIRTIAYSESSQHAGLVLSWVGSDNLLDYIGEEICKKKQELETKTQVLSTDEKQFMDHFIGVEPVEKPEEGKEKYTLTAEHMRELYKRSPAFRDAQDRAAFAVAMTNMERVKATVEHNLKDYADTDAKGHVRKYLSNLETVYKHAGWIAGAARSHKTRENEYKFNLGLYNDSSELDNHHVSDMVAERLELMKDEIAQKRGYRSFGIHVKTENDGLGDYLRRVLHNAIDTVVHGRWLVGDVSSAYAIHKFHGKDRQESPEL